MRKDKKQSCTSPRHIKDKLKNNIHAFQTAQQTRVDNTIRKQKGKQLFQSMDSNNQLWIESHFSRRGNDTFSSIGFVNDQEPSADLLLLQQQMKGCETEEPKDFKKGKLTYINNCVNFIHEGKQTFNNQITGKQPKEIKNKRLNLIPF